MTCGPLAAVSNRDLWRRGVGRLQDQNDSMLMVADHHGKIKFTTWELAGTA